MITLIRGLPGAGKGIRFIREIIRTLAYTDRYVVTNLPLKLPELNAHLQNRYAREWEGQDLNERVQQITREEVFYFYRIRSGGWVLPADTDWQIKCGDLRKEKKKPRLKFLDEMDEIFEAVEKHEDSVCRRGCEYFLDEIHNYYDAREWTESGRPLSWYISQHRHLDDNVWFGSQNPEQMEKRLTMLVQETQDCRNRYMERMGAFKRRGRFECRHYYKCPRVLDSAKPFQTTYLYLDVEAANCYVTRGAIGGGKEKGPETRRKVGGLPWWTVSAGICVIVVLFVAGIAMLPRAVGGGMGWFLGQSTAAVSETYSRPSRGNGVSHEVSAEVNVESLSPVNGVARDDSIMHYRRLFVWGDEVRVTLADGRILTHRDEELERITSDYVVISGVRHYSPDAVPPKAEPESFGRRSRFSQ